MAELIHQYGEERYSRRIARAIVHQRREKPIETALELAELVRRCVPRSKAGRRIDPATRTFQAFRIAVNDELKSLEIALRRLPDCLAPCGRLAVIDNPPTEAPEEGDLWIRARWPADSILRVVDAETDTELPAFRVVANKHWEHNRDIHPVGDVRAETLALSARSPFQLPSFNSS